MGTPIHVHTLLTLRLPGNVEGILNNLRSNLYMRTGAVSTQAIPPVIPLASLPPGTQPDVVDSLPQTRIAPLAVGPITILENTVGVDVGLGEQWDRWTQAMTMSPSGPEVPGPGTGIFLGGRDLCDAVAANHAVTEWLRSNDATDRLPKRLSVLQVELLRIESANLSEWWQNLDWKSVWSRRIKLRG